MYTSPFVDPITRRLRDNGLKPGQVCAFAYLCVLLSLLYWKPCTSVVPTATAENIDLSVMRSQLPISRDERGVAVQTSPSRTGLNGRQNHAEVSHAELPVAPLHKS